MAGNVYDRLVEYRKAKHPNAKEKLTKKQTMDVVKKVLDDIASHRFSDLGPLKSEEERQDFRCRLVEVRVFAETRLEIKPFPAAARGRKNALDYERKELQGRFLKTLEMVPSPIK